MKSIECVLCQGQQKPVLKIAGRTLSLCLKCKLYSVFPRGNWHTSDYQVELCDEAYCNYYRPWRIKQYRQELPYIVQKAPNKRILDVGTGWGWFLQEAAKFGLAPTGLEPQESLFKKDKKYKIYSSSLEDWGDQTKKYGTVALWSVFEHLPEPRKALKKISSLLSKNGLLILQTPNSQGLMNQLAIKFYQLSRGRINTPLASLLQIPYTSKHWFLYNPSNLTLLLTHNNFRILAIKQKDMMSWRTVKEWFESRNKKILSWKIRGLKLSLLAYSLFSTLINVKDEMVILAVKNDS